MGINGDYLYGVYRWYGMYVDVCGYAMNGSQLNVNELARGSRSHFSGANITSI